MTPTGELLTFLRRVGIHVEDRRPNSARPLPFRGSDSEGFGKYRRHSFHSDCHGICVHHSATPQKEGGRLDQYAKTHLGRWASAGGLAYTLAIIPDGTVVCAWDLNLRLYSQGWKDDKTDPATLGDENIKWKGILVDGNFSGPHNPGSSEEPTPEQVNSLEAIRLGFWSLFNMREVTTHSEHGKVACPGETLENWARAHVLPKTPFVSITSEIEIQKALAHLGYAPGPIDGKIGKRTTIAIIAFQREKCLTPDGKVGPITLAALEKETSHA